MFTIKYVYPTGQEMIEGPFEHINAEWVDADGQHIHDIYYRPQAVDAPPEPIYRVVHCHRPDGKGNMTLGPNLPCENTAQVGVPSPPRQSKVFVMNESGATIAKYEL